MAKPITFLAPASLFYFKGGIQTGKKGLYGKN